MKLLEKVPFDPDGIGAYAEYIGSPLGEETVRVYLPTGRYFHAPLAAKDDPALQRWFFMAYNKGYHAGASDGLDKAFGGVPRV